jgi:hypothetical protein
VAAAGLLQYGLSAVGFVAGMVVVVAGTAFPAPRRATPVGAAPVLYERFLMVSGYARTRRHTTPLSGRSCGISGLTSAR